MKTHKHNIIRSISFASKECAARKEKADEGKKKE
jgi:hypothetical protein